MKRIIALTGILALSLLCAMDAFAILYVNPDYVKMAARAATTDSVDAVYFNPAGLVKMDDGFHMELSNQTNFKDYSFKNKLEMQSYRDRNVSPLLPNFSIAYKKGNGALFGGIYVPMGGGRTDITKPQFGFGGLMMQIGAGLDQYQLGVLQSIGWMPSGNSLPALMAAPGINCIRGMGYWIQGRVGGSYALNSLFAFTGGLTLSHYTYEQSMGILRLGTISKFTREVPIAFGGFGGIMITPSEKIAISLIYQTETIGKGTQTEMKYHYRKPWEESIDAALTGGINIRPVEKLSIQLQGTYQFSAEERLGTRNWYTMSNQAGYYDPYWILRNWNSFSTSQSTSLGEAISAIMKNSPGTSVNWKRKGHYKIGLGFEYEIGRFKPGLGVHYNSQYCYPRAKLSTPWDMNLKEWMVGCGTSVKLSDWLTFKVGVNRQFFIPQGVLLGLIKNKKWVVGLSYGLTAKF